MTVAILPLDIKEGRPELNINAVREGAAHVKEGTDILVLPELFSTGFVQDEATFQLLAEPMEGHTMCTLRKLSDAKKIAICGSFLCREVSDGTLRNRAFFINPDDGDITFYDKRHLFILSPEHKLVKPGNKIIPIVKYRDWNIGLTVCFDLRFPVWCRNIGNRYDMLIVPANWPDSRYYAWKHLIIARAIENASIVVGGNRAGSDRFGIYSYLSSFSADERGNIIAETHGNTPLRHAVFDLKRLKEFRVKFPIDKAADNFILNSQPNKN